MFRTLDSLEERAFRQWARDHYRPGADIPEYWHPTVQDECRRINKETFANPVGLELGGIILT
jgi:hypothetical protein